MRWMPGFFHTAFWAAGKSARFRKRWSATHRNRTPRRGAHCAPRANCIHRFRRAREGELPRDFVGRDDLGAPNVASVSRRGAHCAPGDCGLYRFAKLLIHNCVFAACAAALRTRRGQPDGFPLLANQPLSLRARCARKSKYSFPIAAHFPYQGKQNGCHPRGAGAQCAPLRQAERCVPVVGVLPLLVAFRKWAAESLPLRTLRAQRALICGSKCRKSSGRA